MRSILSLDDKQLDPSQHLPYCHEPMTILLVDDDAIFRTLIRHFLTQKGYQVIEAGDGLQALQQLKQSLPDLMICDLNMPIMNGLELVEEVSWQFPTLPMIVVSSTEEMSDVARVLRFGICDFFTKPVAQLEDFSKAIEVILKESQANFGERRDFSSQWFGLGVSHTDQEDELYWHLENLKHNPETARSLLHALLPDNDSVQGQWQSSYHLLQSVEMMPLIFDYSWLIDGRLAFYMVDTSHGGENSVGTALLIRALFNDFLRTRKSDFFRLRDLLEHIESRVCSSTYTSEIPALFGMVDVVSGKVELINKGLTCQWCHQNDTVSLASGESLGNTLSENPTVIEFDFQNEASLMVHELGVRSFRWQIKNLHL